MVLFLVFLIPALLFALSDLRPDFRARNWKVSVVYLAMMTLAAVLCVCVLRDVHLKSPSDIVTDFLQPLIPPG